MRKIFLLMLLAFSIVSKAKPVDTLGLRLEQLQYPFPVKYMKAKAQGQNIEIAYMDVKPKNYNGQTVLLMHGKNFPAAYWEGTINELTSEGYRVIAPDALGFGKSSKPIAQYSFSLLALLAKQLLDKLEIGKVNIIGHSTGGMLAARFVLTYPSRVRRLILEDPLGLEDWRAKGVPYRRPEEWYKEERNAKYDSIIAYHKAYYPKWKEEYRRWADIQYGPLKSKRANQYAKVSALTYDMIFTQPVIYEFENIKVPTLLIIGQEDRTKIARKASPEVSKKLGNYKKLGREAADKIPDCTLIEYKGVGHIPHLQIPARFYNDVIDFLK